MHVLTSSWPPQITVWRLFLLAIAILLLRRLPFMLLAYRWIPDIKTFREAAFTGWFGPMGVGAIFIATLAKTKLPEPHEEGPIGQTEILSATIQPIIFFMVLVSTLCRELRAGPRYTRLAHADHYLYRRWTINPLLLVDQASPLNLTNLVEAVDG
jgi:NhaP-type Na+/H+ or K+/H+ antiporter